VIVAVPAAVIIKEALVALRNAPAPVLNAEPVDTSSAGSTQTQAAALP
ncbi:AI-2E family transporter, partial [Nodosilinea sp. LEGE 07298]|nr:AI-2E family transporter [Nodosilinea sp. LEGE 07298]